ncbi:MAG TPA: hypothetical protein VGC64_11900, partial [Pyrinomonadaceae bacterium]
MNQVKVLLAAALGVLFLTISIAAQAPQSRPKPRAATPARTPAAKPTTPTPTTKDGTQASTVKGGATTSSVPAGTLAVVNGQPILLTDLDTEVRDAVLGFDKEVQDIQRAGLEDQINTYLLEAEAKKRKVTLQQLLDAEVNNRVPAPTEAEIKA